MMSNEKEAKPNVKWRKAQERWECLTKAPMISGNDIKYIWVEMPFRSTRCAKCLNWEGVQNSQVSVAKTKPLRLKVGQMSYNPLEAGVSLTLWTAKSTSEMLH